MQVKYQCGTKVLNPKLHGLENCHRTCDFGRCTLHPVSGIGVFLTLNLNSERFAEILTNLQPYDIRAKLSGFLLKRDLFP